MGFMNREYLAKSAKKQSKERSETRGTRSACKAMSKGRALKSAKK